MKHGSHERRWILLALLLCAMINGCAMQDAPPVEIYTLEPGWNHPPPPPSQDKELAVLQLAPVRGTAAFTNTEISYTDAHHSQHSYAYSRWRDAPVKAMQTVLEVTLGHSGLFAAVLPPTSVSKADYLLESTLLEFGHVLAEDGSSTGVVRMRFHLVNNTGRTLVAGKELTARLPVATQDARGATAAINQAALQVAQECALWLGTVQE